MRCHGLFDAPPRCRFPETSTTHRHPSSVITIRRRRGPHGRRTRLDEPASNGWKRWGPYLSERQWGTVREDYSPGGTAWEALSHDAARSRAYRWGEDGLFGISDDQQILCFALALWNGRDPILKERLFGLTNSEGNHGEDVKECYYYLDATPTHSYLKALYKYPQRAFPYAAARRGEPPTRQGRSGVRADRHRRVRRATAISTWSRNTRSSSPSDICIRITVHNRGPEDRGPCTCCRSCGSATRGRGAIRSASPSWRWTATSSCAESEALGTYRLYREGDAPWLFTENETNGRRLFGRRKPAVISRTRSTSSSSTATQAAINPQRRGTKAAAHYRLEIPAGGHAVVRLRLSADAHDDPFAGFDAPDRPASAGGRRLLRPAAERPHRAISDSCSGRRWPA